MSVATSTVRVATTTTAASECSRASEDSINSSSNESSGKKSIETSASTVTCGDNETDKSNTKVDQEEASSRKSKTTEWIDADRRNSSFFLKPSPVPSRNNLKYWNRTKSAVVSAPAPRKDIGSYSASRSHSLDVGRAPQPPLVPGVSRAEFQNLPSSVQKKYCSEYEKTHSTAPSFNFGPRVPRGKAPPPVSLKRLPQKSALANKSSRTSAPPSRRPSVTFAEPIPESAELDFHEPEPQPEPETNPKPTPRQTGKELRTPADRRPHSVAPDKLDAAILKIQAKRLRQQQQQQQQEQLQQEEKKQQSKAMEPSTRKDSDAKSTKSVKSTKSKSTKRSSRGSFYDSFKWLEDEESLDLRLGWDQTFANNLSEEPAAEPLPKEPTLGHRPSFRRHLSMNKLSFSRPSGQSQSQSRPGTKDTANAPSFRSQPSPAPTKSNGHVRRKSKALSLISLNKQTARGSSNMIDPAASHYQDPSARSTLRQYTASPQKFDEALEYGFPTLGDLDEKDEKEKNRESNGFSAYKLRTFLDDDKSSVRSIDSSVSDPDSPKTPTLEVKPLSNQVSQTCTPSEGSPQLSCVQGPNSREMTLRMTLTRPDLRANEDQIYGWQKSAAARKAHMRGETLAPVQPEKEPRVTDMEKHFNDLDQENIEPTELSGMRRFWKRVRRA